MKISNKFVHELDWSDDMSFIYEQSMKIYKELPYIYDPSNETDFFKEYIKPNYSLYDPDKPLMQVVRTSGVSEFDALNTIFEKYGLNPAIKFFQSDPTVEKFKNVEHLFFAHRHHKLTSVAALVFPIAGCNEDTVTTWPAYEDVDGYEDTTKGIYWSEYYHNVYNKNDPKYLLSDEEAVCRYVLKDNPVLWNVKQFHEAVNKGSSHRVIANINFIDCEKTWEDTIATLEGSK